MEGSCSRGFTVQPAAQAYPENKVFVEKYHLPKALIS